GIPEWLKYKIRFPNRLAYWKYVTPRHGVSVINGAGGFTFVPTPAGPGDKNYFTSNKPIPLLETPWKFSITLLNPAVDEDPIAPNPDPNLSGMLSRTDPGKDYFCTINLMYNKP
ncbi:MAG: hypothetical protein ABL876_07470, partial [Chitinophagaceae bacterium]